MITESIYVNPPLVNDIVAIGIRTLALVVGLSYCWVLAQGSRAKLLRSTIGLALWMGATSLLAQEGVLSRFDFFPPPIALTQACALIIILIIGCSRLSTSVVAATPIVVLVGLQVFRLPLELLMHHAYEVGIMPWSMTYTGHNFDIVTGLVALLLVLFYAVFRTLPRVLVWGFNLMGIGLLLTVVVVAVRASPLFLAYGTQPANINSWVLFFPYVWLPTVLVSCAALGHIWLTRSLLRPNDANP